MGAEEYSALTTEEEREWEKKGDDGESWSTKLAQRYKDKGYISMGQLFFVRERFKTVRHHGIVANSDGEKVYEVKEVKMATKLLRRAVLRPYKSSQKKVLGRVKSKFKFRNLYEIWLDAELVPEEWLGPDVKRKTTSEYDLYRVATVQERFSFANSRYHVNFFSTNLKDDWKGSGSAIAHNIYFYHCGSLLNRDHFPSLDNKDRTAHDRIDTEEDYRLYKEAKKGKVIVPKSGELPPWGDGMMPKVYELRKEKHRHRQITGGMVQKIFEWKAEDRYTIDVAKGIDHHFMILLMSAVNMMIEDNENNNNGGGH